VCPQASPNEHQREPAHRVVQHDPGRLRPAANLRAVLWPARPTLLRAQERVRRVLRGDLQAAVRDLPSPGNGQIAQCQPLSLTPPLH